ncbi:T9SS type A sorting domain-containing protein [Winogradskyella sp. KYW1333]|uniref:T9SS type A sorting domain-containing protein n=1 Tax=Winogradskyella sp. KYW1333 TaxID=2282123 RepID=UPI000DF4A3D5|nr:T9SS type A sorting domain-containing protein [Winogradskyella sp. KYW1333]RCT54050.1 T9SS C-terminal target domain-containing protein [Winogradskyella sp. KYW1333]
MKNLYLCFTILTCSLFTLNAQANYSGNGNTGFGGPVGPATMTISDDGTTITVSFTKGGGDFNDTMVMYISNGNSGRSTIDGNVNDTADSNRRAISNTGSGDISFPTGFEATHGIAINTVFGGLWEIPSSGSIGDNGLNYIDAVGGPALSTDASFSFTFDWTEIGLTNLDGFEFVITYGNPNDNGSNMFSSDEAFGDGVGSGNPGTAAFSFSGSRNYENILSTSENTLDNMTIFINQSSRELIISGQLEKGTVARVYDIQGRLVYNTILNSSLNTKTISLKTVSSGIYIVKLSHNKNYKTEKVILN